MKNRNCEDDFLWLLTITSPLASKRQCKANSELVPPPGNALEQHKFKRFSTVGTRGHCIRELRTMEEHTGPGARAPVRESSFPAHFFPHDNIVERRFSNLIYERLFEN